MRALPLLLVAVGGVSAGCAERRVIVADPTPSVASTDAKEAKAPPPLPRLVVHQRLGRPLRIEGCLAAAACAEWVRYPVAPPRVMVQATASPSGRHFFAWTRADGHARELDVFEVPTAGHAVRTAHLVPGVGGTLVWVDGDRLFHHWGCGTGCAEVQLRDTRGRPLLAASGAWIELDRTSRAAVVEHGGRAVWIDFARGVGWQSAPVPGLLFPSAVAWEKEQVRITFGTSSGEAVLVCRPSPAPTKAPLGVLVCAAA